MPYSSPFLPLVPKAAVAIALTSDIDIAAAVAAAAAYVSLAIIAAAVAAAVVIICRLVPLGFLAFSIQLSVFCILSFFP